MTHFLVVLMNLIFSREAEHESTLKYVMSREIRKRSVLNASFLVSTCVLDPLPHRLMMLGESMSMCSHATTMLIPVKVPRVVQQRITRYSLSAYVAAQ